MEDVLEDVLEVYTRPYDARYPQVCLDETSTQLLTDSRLTAERHCPCSRG